MGQLATGLLSLSGWAALAVLFMLPTLLGVAAVSRRLLGTPITPTVVKNSFERFLSKDRTKPPDIDLDIAYSSPPKE